MTRTKLFLAASKDGGGPEDPMLEERVERLERILANLEPKITEILLTGAKQSEVHKVQIDLAEIKGKVSMLPTWWMLVVALLATWSAGAGIVFALIKATHA
jgi:hypothetical protein